MTLDDFIKQGLFLHKGAKEQLGPINRMNSTRGHVKHPGFESIYARMTTRMLDGRWVAPVLDLATFAVDEPGQGTFTCLIEYLRKTYPDLPIYVESVMEERFGRHLVKLGFKQLANLKSCYWIE